MRRSKPHTNGLFHSIRSADGPSFRLGFTDYLRGVAFLMDKPMKEMYTIFPTEADDNKGMISLVADIMDLPANNYTKAVFNGFDVKNMVSFIT